MIETKKKPKKRSPIKDLPVRLPGQSLREQFDDVLLDKLRTFTMASVVAITLAVLEWLRYFTNLKPMPWFYTIVALIVLAVCAWKTIKMIPMARAINQGRRGEEAVGQFLEEKLRPQGYHILHDIPGDHFNLDHVAIGPSGIFTIETKTISKPERGECRIKYDGTQVTINGQVPTRDPVMQAKAQASWLSDLLLKSTGKRFFVQPVVLYPGWYVENKSRDSAVWVLNERAAITFIPNASQNPLPPDDIALATFHLKRYVLSC